MAFDPAPNAWIPSWSEDGTTISIPIASLPELTADEADGTTGDIRKVLFALADKIFDHWNSLPTADRPAKMTVRRTTITNDAAGTQDRSYTFTFTTAASSEDVVAE